VVRAWRVNASGVLVPTAPQGTHPRPVGWDKLPPAIRAEWDRKWMQATARQALAK